MEHCQKDGVRKLWTGIRRQLVYCPRHAIRPHRCCDGQTWAGTSRAPTSTFVELDF